MVINLYILSLVLGAALLTALLFLGEPGPDAEERTTESDGSPRPSQIGQLDGVGSGHFVLRNLRSRRFWTFFVCFFGMTGLVLDGLDIMSASVSFLVALAVGSVAGAGLAAAIRIGSG